MMKELMQMLDEMFKDMVGKNEDDTGKEMDEDAVNPSRVKHACATVLADMRREIHAVERTLAVLNAKREMLIEEHDALVEEVKALDNKAQMTSDAPPVGSPEESNQPENHAGQPPSKTPSNTVNFETPATPREPEAVLPTEKIDANELVPKLRRGRKAKFSPEFKRLSVHKPTGNPRLDSLETALHDALERLNNAKMAYHFMVIKEVRLALTDLYRAWDKPEAERIAELEAGLKDAVDKLSANRSASNSKIMPEIWGDIIVALQGGKVENQ